MSNIFVSDDGRPFAVFLDSTQSALSTDRKEIIRKLKNGGADLQISPDNADIIVSQEGATQFANSHRQKVVLGVGWVHASVRRGSCYTERENWGDYQVLPDPEESESSSESRPHIASLSKPNHHASASPMFNGNAFHVPVNTPASNLQPTSPMSAMPFGLPLGPFWQQLVSSASQTPSTSQHPSQPRPSYVGQPGQLLTGPTISVPVALQQAILDHMLSLSPENVLSSQLSMLVSLVVQQQKQEQQQNTHASAHAGPSQISMQSTTSVSSAPPSRRHFSPHTTATEHKPKTPANSQRRERARSPSGSRPQSRNQAQSASTSAVLKRKSRDETSTERIKQRRVSHSEDDSRNSARASLKSKKREVVRPSSSSQHGLFTDERGKPIPFYVQSGIKWRNDAVGLIKKHGGVIVAEISEATYAVIWPEADHSYERLREAVKFNKTAVRSFWVHDSAEDGELLDPFEERYTLDGKRLRDQNRKEIIVNIAKMEEEVASESKGAKNKARRSLGVNVKKPRRISTTEQVHRQDGEDSDEDDEEQEVLNTVSRVSEHRTDDEHEGHGERSPSLEPPTAAITWVAGRNKYTDEEMKYCRYYCKRLLKINSQISVTELSARMAKKMPQHSAGSWSSKVGPMRQEIVDALRRTGTAQQIEETAQRSDAAQPTEAQSSSSSSHVKQRSSPPAQPQLPTHYHEDYETFMTFLLVPKVPPVSDTDTLLRLLSSEHTCRSAPSWKQFWDTNHQDITAAVAKLEADNQAS